MQSDVDEFIAHYASKYYDPVKAREYYLRTRELKGRKKGATENLSKESRQRQAEATAYVKNQISTQKKAALERASKNQQAQLERIQQRATAAKERIEKKLLQLREAIDKQTRIPQNASPKLRAFLEKQRAARNRKAKNEASEQLKQIGQDLKDAVSKARTDYAASKKALIEGFAKDLETEQNNIRNKVR